MEHGRKQNDAAAIQQAQWKGCPAFEVARKMEYGQGQKAEQESPWKTPPDQHHQRGQSQIGDQENRPAGTRAQGQQALGENQIQGAMGNAQNNHQDQHDQQLDFQSRKRNEQRHRQTKHDRSDESLPLGIDGVHADGFRVNSCLRNGPAGKAAMTAA